MKQNVVVRPRSCSSEAALLSHWHCGHCATSTPPRSFRHPAALGHPAPTVPWHEMIMRRGHVNARPSRLRQNTGNEKDWSASIRCLACNFPVLPIALFWICMWRMACNSMFLHWQRPVLPKHTRLGLLATWLFLWSLCSLIFFLVWSFPVCGVLECFAGLETKRYADMVCVE